MSDIKTVITNVPFFVAYLYDMLPLVVSNS